MWRVVALGIANAGKSFVLSALANQRGLFPDGELPRLTREIQSQAAGSLLLVDTPAFDGDAAESDLAMREATAADTVLWCHSLRMGELHAAELAALCRYRAHSGTIWKTGFVLTHEDNVASEEIVHAVSARIAQQLGEVFGLRFQGTGEPLPELKAGERRPRPFNVVAIGAYWRAGDLRGKQQQYLFHRSGIPRLRSFLEQLGQKSLREEHS